MINWWVLEGIGSGPILSFCMTGELTLTGLPIGLNKSGADHGYVQLKLSPASDSLIAETVSGRFLSLLTDCFGSLAALRRRQKPARSGRSQAGGYRPRIINGRSASDFVTSVQALSLLLPVMSCLGATLEPIKRPYVRKDRY